MGVFLFSTGCDDLIIKNNSIETLKLSKMDIKKGAVMNSLVFRSYFFTAPFIILFKKISMEVN